MRGRRFEPRSSCCWPRNCDSTLRKGHPKVTHQDNLLISSLALLTHTARIESLRLAVFSPRLEPPVVGRGIVTQLLRQGHPKVNLKTTC